MKDSHFSEDKLRGLSDSAKRWGIGRSQLNELLKTGQIAYLRPTGRERKIPDSAVREWIERSLIRVRGGDAE